MSVQLRVCIEVTNSADEDLTWVRVEQVETVMPATADEDDFSDVAELSRSALQRMSSDCTEKAHDQIGQMCELQAIR